MWVLFVIQVGLIVLHTLLTLTFASRDHTREELGFPSAFFQSINTLHAGMASFSMANVDAATLLLYLLMMFLAPSPFVAVLQRSDQIQLATRKLRQMLASSVTEQQVWTEMAEITNTPEQAAERKSVFVGRVLTALLTIGTVAPEEMEQSLPNTVASSPGQQEFWDEGDGAGESEWEHDVDTWLLLLVKYPGGDIPPRTEMMETANAVWHQLCQLNSYWMPQGLDAAAQLKWGSNGEMMHDETSQGFGRGWCNQRPCLPGRARFYHMPGGLAGATSNFIIGGSHDQAFRTDADAKAWGAKAFLVAAFPVNAEEGDALALALGHATAHGMFILAAPAAGNVITPSALLRIAEDTSCHTNFGVFVLSTNYSATTDSATTVVNSADTMRGVAYWTLPLVLGVASVVDAVTLGERGVPFPAIVLPPIVTAQSPLKYAQAVVDLLTPIHRRRGSQSLY